jgi:restriction system protein
MIVDDGSTLTLEQWLRLIASATGDDLVADYHFPTDVLKEEYIKGIHARTDMEVIDLIRRFLIPSGYLGADKIHLARLSKAVSSGVPVGRFEWERRAVGWMQAQGKAPPPWEGITWIIDLLPHWPGEALKALDAYFLAHAQLLPDGRFSGLADAAELIRSKFIGVPGSTEGRLRILKELTPRGLECIVERLYHKLGYTTILTRTSKDGGRDVIAKRTERTRAEELKIQVKRYESNVGVSALRELLGVVSAEKSNKGVLVTTSDFSRPAKAFAEANPRIELINGVELVLLLNEHDGSWVGHLDRLIMESEQYSMQNNREVGEWLE